MNGIGREALLGLGGFALMVGLLWFGALLGSWFRSSALRREGRKHNQRGQAGERRAEQLLRSHGYRVCGRHLNGSYALAVNGHQEEVQLIADLLVERDGQRWIVEVKTGKQAPRLANADTRRQMLEYQLAFCVPGVLLVDAEQGQIREVRFPIVTNEKLAGENRWPIKLASLLGAIGVFAFYVWAHFHSR